MGEKYTRLFSLPNNQYLIGSPIVIAAGALLKDNESNRILVQLKLQNIGEKEINAVKVSVTSKDSAGQVLGTDVEYWYNDLMVKNSEFFAQKQPIILSNFETRAFEVSVKEVVFNDNSVWSANDSTKWKTISEDKVETLAKSPDMIQQLEDGEKTTVILRIASAVLFLIYVISKNRFLFSSLWGVLYLASYGLLVGLMLSNKFNKVFVAASGLMVLLDVRALFLIIKRLGEQETLNSLILNSAYLLSSISLMILFCAVFIPQLSKIKDIICRFWFVPGAILICGTVWDNISFGYFGLSGYVLPVLFILVGLWVKVKQKNNI